MNKIASDLIKLAKGIISNKRPEDIFKGTFFDINQEAKDFVTEKSKEAIVKIQNALKSDLESKGLKVIELNMSMGKFKGHPYVSTAKLSVQATGKKIEKDDVRVKTLLDYLVKKYSPKYMLKEVTDDGTAIFNIR
jgi:hypothetical protein